MPRSARTCLVPAFALAASASAVAADPVSPISKSDNTLPTVVVIGTTPLPGAESDRNYIPAPVQTATAEDLDRSHAVDVTAFMNRTLGSVYVNDVQNNPLQPDVNYRGYTASPLLGTPQGLSVYLDGVRLNQPFGDVVSWDLIPRAAIAGMTLMPGSNPLFGLNTLGGALALRTKDGFSNPGTSAELSYGSARRRSAELETGGHTQQGLYWYATGNLLRDDGWRDTSPTEANQAFAKLGWRNVATDVSLSGSCGDTDLTGNGLQEQRLLERDYDSVYTKPDITQNRSQLWSLSARHQASDSVTLSANAYYRHIRTHTFNGDINETALEENVYQPDAGEREALEEAGYSGFPTSGANAANTPFPFWRCIATALLNEEPNERCNGLLNRTDTRQHDGGISVQMTFASELAGRGNQLTLGTSQIRSRSHFTQSAEFGYLTPDRGVVGIDVFADGTQDTEEPVDSRVDLTGRTQTKSVYVADTLQVSSITQLTLSGRYDGTQVENRDALTPGGAPGSLDGDPSFSRFNPAIGVTIVPSPKWSAYLGYVEGSRAPSAVELGCADPENPCRLPNSMAGDPPLDQVVTQTLEAGLRGRVGSGIEWNAGVFRATNRDDILFVSDDQAGFGYFRNFGKTRRQGAELGIGGRLGPLNVGAHYTFLDATYRSEERVNGAANSSNDAQAPGFEGAIQIEPGNRIPLTPRHMFKGFTQWDVAPGLAVSADLIAIAGSYARGNENNQHQADGLYYLGPGRTGGYTVVNLGADYSPRPGVKLFVQLNNLFDREYFTASQLAATAFTGSGNFIARPFASPVIDGERPLRHATFYAPGAPRAFWVGVRIAIRCCHFP